MKKILVITSSLVSIYDQMVELSNNYDIYGIYVFDRYCDLSYNTLKLCHILPPKDVFSFAEIKTIIDYIKIMPTLLKVMYVAFKILIKENIKIIYAHWIIPSGYIAVIYKKIFNYLLNKKLIVFITARGSDIKICLNNKLFKNIILYTISQANMIITVNEDIKNIIMSFRLEKNKIAVIYPGINIKKFKPINKYILRRALNFQINDFIVIYVGNLIKLKNVDKLIKIISGLSRTSNISLIIIGDGNEKQNLKKLVLTLKMNNVHFLGSIPNIIIPKYLSLSDVLVLPSKSEGLPISVQEAMACGIPVIVTNVGGLSSIVINNYNGYIVSSLNEIKDKLVNIIDNPDLKEKLGSNALLYARQYLSLNNTISKTINIFEKYGT